MRVSDLGSEKRNFNLRRLVLLVSLLVLGQPLSSYGGRIDGWETTRDQFRRAVVENDANAALEALENFSIYDREEVARILIDYGINHVDLEIYRESEQLLMKLKESASQATVIEAANDHRSWQIRADCARIVSHYQTEESFRTLVELLKDKNWVVRVEAIRGLGQTRELRVVPILIARLQKEKGRILEDLSETLQQLTLEKIPADHRRWKVWWDTDGVNLKRLPDPQVGEQNERKSLGTAVKQGLYGTIVSERVAFLLDTSGSMTAGTDLEGTRFEIATRELIRVLESQIGPKSYFNVISFADAVESFRPQLVKGKGGSIRKGIEFVKLLSAGGETNVYDALEMAFEDQRVDTIYLLSDGSPTVGQETIPTLILRQAQEWNRYRGVKIHCIGFFPGDARNQDKAACRTFLVKLAGENRGRYTEID